MPKSFKLTAKQIGAMALMATAAMYVMLFGGSRSGKTFIIVRAIVVRALAAPESRHAILRFRFNHVKASIIHDTFPKVMRLCYPDVSYRLDKTDWFAQFPNGSQIWFGGLDDKERTEKVLGQEYVSIYLNESSQIPWNSVLIAITRLAQNCEYELDGKKAIMRLKMFFDCNPPSQAHWSFKSFEQKRDPETNKPLPDPENYVSMQINPEDNKENLPATYLQTLKNMPARMRKRFYEGKYADATEGQLWTYETIDKWREMGDMPDMVRIGVAVDPSGSGDQDNAHNDAIGIIVGGLGTDGNAYIWADLTVKAGPATWGRVATDAFKNEKADKIIGEQNYGGEMVKFVVRTALPRVPYQKVTATRGKQVRAEPVASLHEQGKIRFAGDFPELEDELQSFTTHGYIGEHSPNRADAFVWLITWLFPGLTQEEIEKKERTPRQTARYRGAGAWMG